jgi:RNA polymerase sigma-70 factor (ECF subfamily)
METTDIDKNLLVQVAEGDEKAFRRLYDLFNKQVFSQAYIYLQSSELANDAVQEVFIRIWSSKEKLADVKDIRNYIFIVARNVIISDLRRRVLHQYLDEEMEMMDDQTILPDRQLSLKESMKIIQEAIENLSPQQRTAYTLSRNNGLSYDEIAKQMDISLPTVKTHISLALKSLRNYLSQHSVDLALLIIFLIKK